MKLTATLIAATTILTLAAQAQEYRTLPLSTAGQPASGAEIYLYNNNAETPSPVVIIFPGGGYQGLAIDHEGHDMARWYQSLGFAAVVVKYTMPNGRHTVPLADAEAAIATVRANATEWKINPKQVGIIGSSAGGHLAASLSTLAAEANRPDFAILYYPVISFEDAETHQGSKKNLLGNDIANPQLLNRYTLYRQVDRLTPPTLLLLSDDDTAVLPVNSVKYYEALKANKRPAAMYIFPTGGHGWGFRPTFIYHEVTRTLIREWLKEIRMINNNV
jgi:acetyl esterase/lipase